jgi:hypothetical protein
MGVVSLTIAAVLTIVTAFLNSDVAFLLSTTFFLLPPTLPQSLVFLLGIFNQLVHRPQLCHILFCLLHAETSDGRRNWLRVRRVKDCEDHGLALLLLCHYPTPSGVTVDTVICITHRHQLNKYTAT